MSEHEAPSPRALRVMAAVRWALLVAVTALASTTLYRFWGPLPERAGVVADARYYCPMHPQIRASAPGECPICHMALVRIPDEHAPAAATHAHDAGEARDAGVEGIIPVTLALDRQQLGGVVSEPVTRGAGRGALRVPAVIEAPETGRAQVRVRAAGFVERVAVRETGVAVARGQALAWVYSPQVFQAQQELLATTRWTAQPGGGRSAEVAAASRQALELLGMAPSDIDAMVRAGAPTRAVPLRAPVGGYVLRNAAVLGMQATPDVALYELADLSRVWVAASVWERDLARVRRGAAARFVTPEGASLAARVLLVEPEVSAATRAARVRLELANPAMALRPGMYGEALFGDAGDAGDAALTVPRDAVIDTGRARYVFVQSDDVTFEPRRVRTGALVDDRWEVLDGVREGERVVSRGAFMVDSESRLRAALTAAPGGAR